MSRKNRRLDKAIATFLEDLFVFCRACSLLGEIAAVQRAVRIAGKSERVQCSINYT